MTVLLRYVILAFFLTQIVVGRQEPKSLPTKSLFQNNSQSSDRVQPLEGVFTVPEAKQPYASYSNEKQGARTNDDKTQHEAPKSKPTQDIHELSDNKNYSAESSAQPTDEVFSPKALPTSSLNLSDSQSVVRRGLGNIHTIAEVQTLDDRFVCAIMERIRRIFGQRLPPGSGSQFAVVAIIPRSVQNPEDIGPFMDPEYENINYRFTQPTRFRNQRCRTHAEVVAMNGGPGEENYNLRQLLQAYTNNNPRNPPSFSILYTWIHPCRDCTNEIINTFGRGDHSPVWDIPTYIGRTTAGIILHPPLTDQDRQDIANMFAMAALSLFHIKGPREDEIALVQEEIELCDTCTIGGDSMSDTFNCNEEERSVSDELRSVSVNEHETCSEQVHVRITATGKTCKSDNECGYRNRSYSWCYTTDGSWDYCCTGQCGNHGNTGYDWCESGNKRQPCKRQSLASLSLTASGKHCRSDSQCGFHGNTDYAWCYTVSGNWDYCCTSECEQYDQNYDWCTTGSEWQYCKRDISTITIYSASGKRCKSACSYNGKDYFWCYTTDDSWDYCCTSECGIHSSGGNYDWCTSGKKWSKCKVQKLPYPRYTYNLKECRSDHECGFHGGNYAWCYTAGGGWDYCCTQNCDLHGQKYDWCTTGSSWQYCGRKDLPNTAITAKGASCWSKHKCGYYDNTYSWCYTDSVGNWDYCCSSTCGKYGSSQNFCAAGKYTVNSCCCSKYD